MGVGLSSGGIVENVVLSSDPSRMRSCDGSPAYDQYVHDL